MRRAAVYRWLTQVGQRRLFLHYPVNILSRHFTSRMDPFGISMPAIFPSLKQ